MRVGVRNFSAVLVPAASFGFFLINFTDCFEVFSVITVVSVLMLVYYRTSVGKMV